MDIYQRLKVKKLINAAGTYTIVGGSRMSAETLRAMAEAAASHVDLPSLQRAVNQRIAEVTRNESAYVTCGAAAGIFLTAAACIARKVRKPLARLTPDVTGGCEFIIHRAHRNGYDWALRQLGVKLVEIGYPNPMSPTQTIDLTEAISEKTAGILYVSGGGWVPDGALSLDETMTIAAGYGIPLIVDAAAQLPPVENLWRFTQSGAAAAVFSGGKDLRGPQASGLIVGEKWLTDICLETGFPNHGIARMLKVGREEMVGLMTAVEQFVAMDHEARKVWCDSQVALIQAAFANSAGVRVERSYPNEAGQPLARALVRLEPDIPGEAERLSRLLMEGSPGIYTKTSEDNGVYINPMTLTEDEVKTIIARLRDVISGLKQ